MADIRFLTAIFRELTGFDRMANYMASAAPDDSFAAALRKAILNAGMSRAGLARETGIDQSHIYKMLRGKVRHPHERTLSVLADALNAPQLLDFSGWNAEDEIAEIRQDVREIQEQLRELRELILGARRDG